jgi:hypothetical protein
MPEPTITTSADAAAEENDRVAGLLNGLLSSRRVADMAVLLDTAAGMSAVQGAVALNAAM